MAKRRRKPPGYENWTWAEIDAGRKMSRGQRSAARRWGVLTDGTGSAGGKPMAMLWVAVVIIGTIVAIFSGMR